LLVHGDPAVQELTSRALARIDVDVDVVGRGTDAVVSLDAQEYSAIVIDRAVSDGLLAEIAARPDPRPIVIVTAPMEESKSLDTETVSLFVPTPYDVHTLVGVILACVTDSDAGGV
jgi:DNA-binding response OmpR family regulator